MAIVLGLRPEIERRLTALTALRALFVGEYTQNLLQSLTSLDEEPAYDSMSPEQWVKEFEEWLYSHEHIAAPPLSGEAISHESIYREREDS